MEALLTEVPLPAIAVGGNLDIGGNVDVYGTKGTVHANGDLDIGGGAASVAVPVTASGTYTGSPPPAAAGLRNSPCRKSLRATG